MTVFHKLNEDWNAQPNSPEPFIQISGSNLILSFFPNYYIYPEYKHIKLIELTFFQCSRYRLGSTNDEGWYRGQCRFSKLAPAWGEFYEIVGDLLLDDLDDGWIDGPDTNIPMEHHYLFYFRDEIFECDAASWSKRDVPKDTA